MFRAIVLICALLLVAAVVASCGEGIPSPRERVLEFVKMVRTDSLPDIAAYIDLDSVANYEYAGEKYAELSHQEKKNRLLSGFMRQGEYRGVWARSQIVVNEETRLDDTTATVEISFIDRATRIQYLSHMGLKKRKGAWMICNFKVE